EHETAAQVRVVERFDAETIARDQQPLLPPIPQRECEHPAQMKYEIRTKILIQVHDHLGIAPGGQLVAARQQLLLKRREVVNLAIEHDRYGAVLVGDRLPAVVNIDDAQPSHAHTDVRPNEETFVV